MPPTKKFLLEVQSKIMSSIARGNRNFNMLAGASASAIAVKVQHALELLETQTLYSLQSYMYELFNQANKKLSKATQQLVKNIEFNHAFIALNEMLAKKIENPKLIELKRIVESEIKQNPKSKIIIFSQYRDTVSRICKEMNSIDSEKIKSKVFIGQATKTNHKGEQQEGLSQKEQQELIQEFSRGKINLVCSTSIGEEGLDIPEVNAVIFYEPIPSAIRTIQRRGRTARLMKGKLIILLVKGTRDEAYYWAAFHKEKKMHRAIQSIKDDLENGTLNLTKKENSDEDKKESRDKQERLFE
jgi:Fanconi anemia group M protein